MSFRVLTYIDPYELQYTSFWPEIKALPHLCSSSVMAQSLWSLYHKRDFEAFFWPVEDLVSVAYPDWHQNVERKIAQFISVSKKLRTWREIDRHKRGRNSFFDAMEHNKSDLADALRLFVELDIDLDSLHEELANTEQKAFIAMYGEIRRGGEELSENYALSDSFCEQGLNALLLTLLAQSRVKEEDSRQADHPDERAARDDRINRLDELDLRYRREAVTRVVVHGVHQFSALQLRLITRLSDMDIEVIFLYNYLPQFKRIYATWDRLYRLLGIEIKHDSRQPPMTKSAYPKSNELACAFGALLDSQVADNGAERLRWIAAIRDVDLIEFQNTTEMANFVAVHLEKAIVQDVNFPMRHMAEKVYSTAREVDDLLRIFYPSYAGDRHFLRYPIGQFFMGLYRLWDEEVLRIRIEIPTLRECAVAGLIRIPGKERLTEILNNLEPYIVDVTTYDGFMERMNVYLEAYAHVLYTPQGEMSRLLGRVSFYDPGTITLEEARAFVSFVEQLNTIAIKLFTEGGQPVSRFMDHFRKLDAFIQEKALGLADEQERILIQNLLERFSQVSLKTNLSGTMDDLRHGLYFYLRQKDIERPEWVVRNFAQIEGDVLRSRRQSNEDAPTYHFACLTDRLMSKQTEDLLPWPLTDHFIHTAYSPNALIFQMYYSALCDYQDFLRYSLFYGLYFNQCKVRLSYIRDINKRQEELYFPLKLLRITPHPSPQPPPPVHNLPENPAQHLSRLFHVDQFSKINFFLCPYKYYLDYVCNDDIVYDTSFLIKRYYENLLVNAAWRRYENNPYTDVTQNGIHIVMRSTQEELSRYFPFLRDANDKHDLLRAAENYFTLLIDPGTGKVRPYAQDHMRMRFLFKKAVYPDTSGRPHPYPAFEAMVVVEENGQRFYKLHAIRTKGNVELLHSIRSYMEANEGLMANPGEWCYNCVQRPVCLEPFRIDLDIRDGR